MLKVVKFGGTSLADATNIRKVRDIIKADPSRRFVVPSAPGKRFSSDEKITDMLYKCHTLMADKAQCDSVFDRIAERFINIAKDLGIKTDGIANELEQVRQRLHAGCTKDFIASRGEYLNAHIISEYLGFEFVDAAEIIRFSDSGQFLSDVTNELASKRLSGMQCAVIPGFYGAQENGEIKTFSRGGSDYSGSLIARAVNADLYENWTDVSGFLVADPRIVDNPKIIRRITYKELRELSYMGATVLHEDAVFPVRISGIPINIKNTNIPDEPGTLIIPNDDSAQAFGVTGIAGKKGFTIITIEKDRMNSELGFARRVLSVLERHGVSLEHLPTSIDAMSVVVADSDLEGKLDTIIAEIKETVNPDSVMVEKGIAMVATV
ncbi:MAG TPA: aspartate kinase, partial [Clostridia bacterium]|nr:aspartate kinase [Clostridia bacterium]